MPAPLLVQGVLGLVPGAGGKGSKASSAQQQCADTAALPILKRVFF